MTGAMRTPFARGRSPGMIKRLEADLACLPDLFARRLPSPLDRGQRPARRRPGRGPQFQQVLDLEAAAAKQPDHVAVAEVELHRVVVRTFDSVHTEVRPQQLVGRWGIVLVRAREDE